MRLTTDALRQPDDECAPEEDPPLHFQAVARLDPDEKTLVCEVVESSIVRHGAGWFFVRATGEEASP